MKVLQGYKEDHQLRPCGPSNGRKRSGPNARSTGVQLKSAAKLSTVIGFITKHTDCRMTFKASQYVCDVLLLFETDQEISPTHNLFELVY